MIETVVSEISIDLVKDISIGTFRMNKDYLKNIRKQREDTDVIHYPYAQSNGTVHYPERLQSEITSHIVTLLQKNLNTEKIYVL